MKTVKLFLIGIAMFVFACGKGPETVPTPAPFPVPDKPITVNPPTDFGTVTGTIKFVGAIPPPKTIKVNKDNQVCGEKQTGEELVVNSSNRGIRFAVVSFQRNKDIDSVPITAIASAATLDQKGCRFSPHVLVVQPGVPVKILNPDGVLHNFHTYSQVNPTINKAQPGFKKEMTAQFDKPEAPFRIGCDAHGWMSGWIMVKEHPFYALTDEKGNFKIEGVPAGKRVLKVWHESLGEVTQEVDVKANDLTPVIIQIGSRIDAKGIFETSCAVCHGISGKGDGPAAAALPSKPADFTSKKVQGKSNGELAATIRNGTDKGMPPWKQFSDEEVQALVNYIRNLGIRSLGEK